ncbi:MAG: tRNA(His) guanylyltransferase Thg1 family protein [Candidatus Omnitrophota bacterium]
MDLSDRMKYYENLYCGPQARLMPLAPAMARLDGKAFHSFCRGLARPFDDDLRQLMHETAKYLVKETHAVISYTQSDEITLIWQQDDFESKIFFDGRVAKMTSLLASMASVFFNKQLPTYLPKKAHLNPLFDCRVWSVPTEYEATNALIWREVDAVRNSILMVAQSLYSHSALQGKKCDALQEMIFQKGINWNDYADHLKRGAYFKKVSVFHTKADTGETYQRSEYHQLSIPIMTRIANREDVVFRGAEPILKAEV